MSEATIELVLVEEAGDDAATGQIELSLTGYVPEQMAAMGDCCDLTADPLAFYILAKS